MIDSINSHTRTYMVETQHGLSVLQMQGVRPHQMGPDGKTSANEEREFHMHGNSCATAPAIRHPACRAQEYVGEEGVDSNIDSPAWFLL